VLDLLHLITPEYTLSGLLVGALVGLTGVGGGSLMTPLLVLLFGINPAVAVGTDLLYAALTKSGGMLVHGFNRNIDWRIVRRMASGSVPTTLLSLLFLSHMTHNGAHPNGLITYVLGIALILTAMALFVRGWILKKLVHHVAQFSDKQTRWLTYLLGTLLGVLVSLSSVGAGAIGMLVLLVLYNKTPIARLVGSDIAHAVPLTLIAGLGHWYMGSVNFSLLFSLLIGSLPGIAIGSFLAARAPDRVLRPILATTLATIGLRLVA